VKYPPLVHYDREDEYLSHYERVYCKGPIATFDGIEVRFRKGYFAHCFYESIHSKDDTFSKRRAERIDWIRAALQDPKAELRVGWDNEKRTLSQIRTNPLWEGK
jgi:hypothetical protein